MVIRSIGVKDGGIILINLRVLKYYSRNKKGNVPTAITTSKMEIF
jgi:hypothetical protein